nr:hypothetical protein F6W77_19695 [Acinetobacter baumannii]
MNSITVFLGSLLLTVAAATEYTSCGGEVQSVTVTNCDSSPCILKSGSKPEITIAFKSLVDTNDVKVKIWGVIRGVPLPFPGPQTSACEGSGLSCPLEKNKSYTYRNAIDVKPMYPKLEVTVKYELQDDNNNSIVCVLIPSKIE